jgi:hypothetical protein
MGGLSNSGYRFVALLGAALTLQGCLLDALLAEPDIDLARNPYIYKRSEYVAPRRTTAPVFVTRLKDKRELPDIDKGPVYRVVFSDRVWTRTIPVMVEELLIEEIDHSKIYNGLSTGNAGTPKRTDIILEPTLLQMYRMRESPIGNGSTGRRRTVAVSSLRIRVRSAVDAIGVRRVLMDEVFHEIVATRPSLARPEEGLALSGRTMEQIIQRALIKLYESNSVAQPETQPETQPGTKLGTVPASAGKSGEKNTGAGR